MSDRPFQSFYHYLPVNDAALSWGIYLTGLGRGHMPALMEHPSPGHPGLYDLTWSRGRILPELQLILISEGQGVFESEPTGEVQIKPGYGMTLFPGVWHRYKPSKGVGWHEHWISLNGVMMHRLKDLQLIDPSRSAGKRRGSNLR